MSLPAQETYDRLASVYDRRWAYYTEATLRTTLDGLDVHGGARVLDLAAGTGELARRLLERWPGIALVGLDVSQGMLVQGHHKSALRRWRAVQGDVGRLPLADAAFDVVLCTNAFHHFAAPAFVLQEVRRVLRREGGWS